MPVDLQDFELSDTNYVSKLNNNNTALEAFAEGVDAQLAAAVGTTISIGQLGRALLGSSVAVIGAGSFECTGASSTLTVQPGYAWTPSNGAVVRLAAAATVSFAGASAATYYITAPGGVPTRGLVSTNALYSVVWNGSAFGTITLVAAVMWGAADWTAAQVSTALAATYDSPDERFEAIEELLADVELARTAQTGRVAKSVAGSADVTLTAVEANNTVIELTGAITADIDVIVPTSGPRAWLVVNSTTGDFRITLKVSGQTGVTLPGSGGKALCYHDGTDAKLGIVEHAPLTLPSATTLSADFARSDVVRCTISANSTITLTGARDGQKCTLEVTQSGGGFTLGFGAEVAFGTELASITLDTTDGAFNVLGFIYNAGAAKYRLVAQATGY